MLPILIRVFKLSWWEANLLTDCTTDATLKVLAHELNDSEFALYFATRFNVKALVGLLLFYYLHD